MATYLRSQLKQDITSRLYNKTDMLSDFQSTLNRGVRNVLSDLDLRSSKRKYSSPPKLMTDIYDYTCPTDMKGIKIIDLQPQVNRSNALDWHLTSEEEFDRRKKENNDLIAFTDRDMARKIMVSTAISDESVIIGQLDTLTGDGGTWTLFGDGTGLVSDTDNYVKGSGAIKWDISAAGGTTAGIYNSGLNSQDISEQVDASGSAFCWIYIYSTTNLTNWILRLGSSSTAYHQYTATTAHGGTAFTAGWNLISWDLSSPTDTGTPDDTAIDYAAIYMTKDAAKISETDYRCDWLVVKKGDYFNIIYYSKYLWQNSSGTWIENSTADTDYINVDTEEYNLVVEKCIEEAALEMREDVSADTASKRYDDMKEKYLKGYKSERLRSTNKYYNFGSINTR